MFVGSFGWLCHMENILNPCNKNGDKVLNYHHFLTKKKYIIFVHNKTRSHFLYNVRRKQVLMLCLWQIGGVVLVVYNFHIQPNRLMCSCSFVLPKDI